MTNGNSAERERFEKWIGEQRPEEQGMEQFSWDDCWSAWQARAALSVCADGGKGEAVALWAAFAPEGNLLAHSKIRPGLSDILNWEPLYRTAPQAECAPREAQNVMNIPLDAAATMADYVPQAECASRAEDPDWMGKLPKCTEWPSGVAPRAEPVEESDVRPKERLCGGSHISCNGVDYCLGHPSCRDIANERAKKEQK